MMQIIEDYNGMKQAVSTANDYETIADAKRKIISFTTKYSNTGELSTVEISSLFAMLEENIEKMLQKSEAEYEQMQEQVSKAEQEAYNYPSKKIDMNKVNEKTLEIMATLPATAEDYNKTMLSIKTGQLLEQAEQDRETAYAILNLFKYQQFSEMFTEYQKKTVLELTKTKEQREQEEKTKTKVESLQKKASEKYMEGFRYRKLKQDITQSKQVSLSALANESRNISRTRLF